MGVVAVAVADVEYRHNIFNGVAGKYHQVVDLGNNQRGDGLAVNCNGGACTVNGLKVPQVGKWWQNSELAKWFNF